MKVAALDLGTNSFLCLIAEVSDGKLQEIEDSVEIVRLGERVGETGQFAESALGRADSCLKKFKNQIDQFNITKVRAVATSAARDVSNGQLLLDLGKKYSIPIEIIEGKKEAELTFKGVLTGQHSNTDFAVIDIGGGSTEFAFYKNNDIQLTSLNLGCVRHTEKYLSVDVNTKEQVDQFKDAVKKELDRVSVPRVREIVAVAGTPTTLACVKAEKSFEAKWVENSELTVEDLIKMEIQFAQSNLEQRKKIQGMEPKRADVILSGTIILRMITEKFGFKSVRVSTRGVRYGVALELGSL